MIHENGALVEFYRGAVQNNFKTAEAGRPIFDERDFVRVQTPGDTKTVIETIASDQYKNLYPKAWDAYSRGLEAVTDGTPITEWPSVTVSQARELQYINIRTVETLAEVSDANIQQMGPGYMQLRQRAREYIDAAKGSAAATATARENEKLREEMSMMKEQIEALRAQLAADSDEKRGPGRPKKTE